MPRGPLATPMGGIGEKEQARHHLLVDEEGPLLKVGERVKQEMFTNSSSKGVPIANVATAHPYPSLATIDPVTVLNAQ